ncbi:MAG: hypothetical protein ACREXU_01920, partial [Gammaproteobacteria bacterium]
MKAGFWTLPFRVSRTASAEEPAKLGNGLLCRMALSTHQVHPLARTLDESGACQRLGEPAVARILLVEDVLRTDAG